VTSMFIEHSLLIYIKERSRRMHACDFILEG
jgi:hypothetical protein